ARNTRARARPSPGGLSRACSLKYSYLWLRRRDRDERVRRCLIEQWARLHSESSPGSSGARDVVRPNGQREAASGIGDEPIAVFTRSGAESREHVDEVATFA